jgi:hypothetical protein
MNTDGLIHLDLSERIIGCAMTVHNSLKPGLREKTYERALVHELAKNGLKTDQQRHFDVTYDGKVIDTLIPDLIVARECFQTTRRGLTTDASPNGCALKSPPPNRLRFWFRGAANRRCEQKGNSVLRRRLADPRNPPRSRSGGALPVAEPLGDASVVKTGLVVLCLRVRPGAFKTHLNAVIVDAKCVTAFDDTHIAQIIGYLSITGLRLGLLINFKHARLQWKRIVQ